jgi:hypothetical protein
VPNLEPVSVYLAVSAAANTERVTRCYFFKELLLFIGLLRIKASELGLGTLGSA